MHKSKSILIIRPNIEQIQAHLVTGHKVAALLIWDKYSPYELNKAIKNSLPSTVKLYELENNKLFIKHLKKNILLRSIILETGANIIVVNGIRDLLSVNFSKCLLRMNQRPKIVGLSRNPTIWKSRIKSKIAILLIKKFTDGFITLSSSHLKMLINAGVDKKRIIFIPNAFNPEGINKLSIESLKSENIIYVANIESRKGQLILIKALGIVKNIPPDFKCLIIGRVLDSEYKQLLEETVINLHLESNIEFTGWLDHTSVLEKIKNCSLFVFPSYAEMMPRAVIEAMWMGKPVIASRVDGIIDLIEDGCSGILVEPGNINQLSDAILLLLKNKVIASQYAKSGQKFVRSNCSIDRVGHLYNLFYDQLLFLPKK